MTPWDWTGQCKKPRFVWKPYPTTVYGVWTVFSVLFFSSISFVRDQRSATLVLKSCRVSWYLFSLNNQPQEPRRGELTMYSTTFNGSIKSLQIPAHSSSPRPGLRISVLDHVLWCAVLCCMQGFNHYSWHLTLFLNGGLYHWKTDM